MNTYIAISPIEWDDEVPKIEYQNDGTVIFRLFNKTAIIQTSNDELIGWLEQALDITADDVCSFFYLPNDTLKTHKWEHYSTTRYGNKTSEFYDRFNGTFEATEKAVCIIDTGVAPHVDLDDNRIAVIQDNMEVYAFSVQQTTVIPHYSIDDETQYIHPHGTHVAGIAGAVGNNSKGVFGVYFKNKIFSINVFQLIGNGVGAYISSILTALNLCGQFNNYIRTINMSLGGGYSEAFYKALLDAYEYLEGKEILVIVAAGNSNIDISILKPLPAYAKTTNSFTIGSGNIYGQKSWFSNYNGEMVDCLVAGGTADKALSEGKFSDEDILAPVPSNTTDEVYSIIEEDGTKYGWMAGTSMASPYAAGFANIFYELLTPPSFSVRCEAIRACFAGATYLHSRDAFDQCTGGGIFDASQLKGSIVRAKILEYSYDDENEKLKLQIKNQYSDVATIFVSASVARFTAKTELPNPDMIAYSEFSFEGEETKWVELSITLDQYYGAEKIGVLTAIYAGGTQVGTFDKLKIYNKIECPLPPPLCNNISIRCDEQDYFPFSITNINLLQGGLISTIAERAQKRLLFFRNSQKNVYGKYEKFLPIATNGLCLNTTNYPQIKTQFPARIDATETDVIIALWSIYTQLQEIYEHGIIGEDGKRWYIFDYQYWRESGKTKFRRKKLQNTETLKVVLDESYCRPDRVGLLVKAILYMLYWSKVVFSVQYALLYQMKPNYTYSARFDNEIGTDKLAEDTYNIVLYSPNKGLISAHPPDYTDGQGYRRYRYSAFSDPYDPENPYGDWVYDTDLFRTDESIKYMRVVDSLLEDPVNAFGIKRNYEHNLYGAIPEDTDYSEYETKYQFFITPANIWCEPNTETEDEYTPSFDDLQQWQSGDINGSYISDVPPHAISGTDKYVDVFCDKVGYKYRLSYCYLLEVEDEVKIKTDMIRIAIGYTTKLKPQLGQYCWEPTELPVSLAIKASGGCMNHWDTAELEGNTYPESLRNKNYDVPHGQPIRATFRIRIYLVDPNENKELVYSKTKTLYNYASPSIDEFIDQITIDVPYDYHLLIETKPIAFKDNPSHTLIIPVFGDATIQIPPFRKLMFALTGSNWTTHATYEYPIQFENEVYGIGVYTRHTALGIYVYPADDDEAIVKYEDIRGLPNDDYFTSILNSLKMARTPFTVDDEEYEFLGLKCCGWQDFSEHITGTVVVDQLPPPLYPKNFISNNKLIVHTAEAPLGNAIEYERETPQKVLYHSPDVSMKAKYNYICPNNQLIYKPDDMNFSIGIEGKKQAIYPDLIGSTVEEAEELVGDGFTIEEIDHYYFESEEEKIVFQFPDRFMLIEDLTKTIYVITGGKNKDDYELKMIPDLTMYTESELAELLADESSWIKDFTVFYKYVPSALDGCIVFQFPRNVCYINKGIEKPYLFLLAGKRAYSLVSKLINRRL